VDNSGRFASDTQTTPTVKTSCQTVGSHTVGVRLTDSQGLTTTTTVKVTVLEQGVSDYEDTVLGTAGLIDYYKLGEPHGPTIADSKGSSNGRSVAPRSACRARSPKTRPPRSASTAPATPGRSDST
jgi:hypothetical protein